MVGKLPKRRIFFRRFLPAEPRLLEVCWKEEAGGGEQGLVLIVSSLCKPLTVKGVKLLRCFSLVAWK